MGTAPTPGGASARQEPLGKLSTETGWQVGLYPHGHAFAFTIVHDADSAYSRRLAPLFDEFDRLNLKLTVTAFVFWASWAKQGRIWSQWNRAADPFLAPIAVPLADTTEREFYLDLAARGHDVAMHTASETSDTTDDLRRAFECFAGSFGRAPTVYVEHSRRSKKDALENEGANPRSKYYSLGVLNDYSPWVWVDGPLGWPSAQEPKFYDLRAANGAPFTEKAAQKYGLKKVFMRTGKGRQGDGEGFLDWYSTDNIDELERDRGLALVYTHLNEKWLDLQTCKMREPLRERLRYLAAKNGWFAPAAKILDRVAAMREVTLIARDGRLQIHNHGLQAVEAVTIVSPNGCSLRAGEQLFRPGPRGDITVGTIPAVSRLEFQVCSQEQ
jgi:hypothetical protein